MMKCFKRGEVFLILSLIYYTRAFNIIDNSSIIEHGADRNTFTSPQNETGKLDKANKIVTLSGITLSVATEKSTEIVTFDEPATTKKTNFNSNKQDNDVMSVVKNEPKAKTEILLSNRRENQTGVFRANSVLQKPSATDYTKYGSLPDKFQLNRSISISEDSFILDGRPLRIISGSLHYFRVPAAYWRDRLRKLRAAGLNAVATYVEWSFHEPEERQYRFDGDYDVANFVRLAAEEGLLVLLRPGPYICAERDLGGIPYWLLSKHPRIKLRSIDKDYLAESDIWLNKLFEHLSPLLYGNGGPIILVQVENEYGSYGKDKVYMKKSRDALAHHVKTAALLYTTDGSYKTYFQPGSVPQTLTTIDFGINTNVSNVFTGLRKFMHQGPLMNSEFYPGWLTHWGESISEVETKEIIKTLKEMLDYGVNVNFYMFFGGTNFEFTSGANYDSRYLPDITSYDYDAPLTEAGDPTPKYDAIRNTLEEYFPEVKLLPKPTISKKGAYGPVTLKPRMRLLYPIGRQALGKKYASTHGARVPSFEKLRQRAGYVLYEVPLLTTKYNATENNTHLLKISIPRDRIYVYIDGELEGIISRMDKIYSIPITFSGNVTLSLLVENQGRINFGSRIHDFKGIPGVILLDNMTVSGDWEITGYPLEDVHVSQELSPSTNNTLPENDRLKNGPVLYEGSFMIPDNEEPLDTFFDPTSWIKGSVWVNGHNLGRYWTEKGPQITLYVPGVWLKAAPQKNTVQVIEFERAASDLNIIFIDTPVLNRGLSRKSRNRYANPI